jgi:hypothetical protein
VSETIKSKYQCTQYNFPWALWNQNFNCQSRIDSGEGGQLQNPPKSFFHADLGQKMVFPPKGQGDPLGIV